MFLSCLVGGKPGFVGLEAQHAVFPDVLSMRIARRGRRCLCDLGAMRRVRAASSRVELDKCSAAANRQTLITNVLLCTPCKGRS